MPLKPSYLLLTGAGGVVLYAGFKGKGVGSALRDVIAGQSPKNALAANQIITANYGTGGGSGGGGGGGIQTSASASERSFFSAVLTNLGAPVTAANLETMYTWAKKEEPGFPPQNVGGYSWNPLNIKNVSGGFQQWGSPTQGAYGTSLFMLQNNYGAIIAALRSGHGLIGNTDPNVAAELSAWSGGGYSSI